MAANELWEMASIVEVGRSILICISVIDVYNLGQLEYTTPWHIERHLNIVDYTDAILSLILLFQLFHAQRHVHKYYAHSINRVNMHSFQEFSNQQVQSIQPMNRQLIGCL